LYIEKCFNFSKKYISPAEILGFNDRFNSGFKGLMAIKRKYKLIWVHYGDISCESVEEMPIKHGDSGVTVSTPLSRLGSWGQCKETSVPCPTSQLSATFPFRPICNFASPLIQLRHCGRLEISVPLPLNVTGITFANN